MKELHYDANGNISHVAYEDDIIDENSLELHRLEVKEALYQAIRKLPLFEWYQV